LDRNAINLYATAGFGGAKGNYNFSAKEDGQINTANVGLSSTGAVFGVGAEYKMWSNIILRAEYLHYALARDTALPFDSVTGPSPGDHANLKSVDVVRFGASYLFNWGR
jgi:opacity protein-like surface antigen